MTLDAMHWVWTNSQSKGNARLALLYIADQVRTQECEARVSYPDLMTALNASSKSTVRDALKAAEKLGELEVKEPGSGRRPPLYKLPKAVNYTRPSGTGSVPQDPRSGTGSVPQSPEGENPSGTEPVPHQDRSGTDFVRSGTDFAPIYPSPSVPSKQAGAAPHPHHPAVTHLGAAVLAVRPGVDDHGIPDFARPLVDALTNAGVVVRWPWRGNQWFPIHALIKKCGIPAMVDYAVKVAARTNVESAKYFLPGWTELAPQPQQPIPTAREPSPNPSLPEWCGQCDSPDYRWLERDGREYRCPNCNPDVIGART